MTFVKAVEFVVLVLLLCTAEHQRCMTAGAALESDLETAERPSSMSAVDLAESGIKFLDSDLPSHRSSPNEMSIFADDVNKADQLIVLDDLTHSIEAIYDLQENTAVRQHLVDDVIGSQETLLTDDGGDDDDRPFQAATKRQLDVNLGFKGYIRPRIGRS